MTRITAASLKAIEPFRARYLQEMACQVIHDSLHRRPDWTESYMLSMGSNDVGYGSIVQGGPWAGSRIAFEFYVLPEARDQADELFVEFARKSSAQGVLVQSNDAILLPISERRCIDLMVEALLFADSGATSDEALTGRLLERDEVAPAWLGARTQGLDADRFLAVDGQIVGVGGYLTHYNPPYVDLYMEVFPEFRRRGYGTAILRHLQKLCRDRGFVPAARCGPHNDASAATLVKAGFVRCGDMRYGRLALQPASE